MGLKKHPRLFVSLIQAALFIFSLKLGSSTALAESPAAKEKRSPTKTMKSDSSSVTIPSELFERLLEDFEPQTVADLFEYLSIDAEEQRKIYPAYQTAEKAAREKQRALSATGSEKIALKMGIPVTIKGLSEAEIDACVAVFSKNLNIAISNNTRKILCLQTRMELKRDFSETSTVELQNAGVLKLPNGTLVGPIGVMPMPRVPAHLKKYCLKIQPYKEGKPIEGSLTVFPNQIMEGKRYDFLTIETEDEPAKLAPEKPKEVPAR